MKSSTHLFKKTQQSGNRRNLPKHNKGHIWQIHCQHLSQWAKNTRPLKIGNKTSLIQHSAGSPSHRNQTRSRSIQIGKEEVKLSLVTDNIILYIENPKDSTKKLLELINEFRQVAGYKINIQKSVAFLYANNEQSEREN